MFLNKLQQCLVVIFCFALLGIFVGCDDDSEKLAEADAAPTLDGAAASTKTGLKWFADCGDAVCRAYRAKAGVKLCGGEEVEGGACAVAGKSCDPKESCNRVLHCAASAADANIGECALK